MDIESYNILCGADNMVPRKCHTDYFFERVMGGSEEKQTKTYSFSEVYRDPEIWGVLLKYLRECGCPPSGEKKIIKLIQAKKTDTEIYALLKNILPPIDPIAREVERKKAILKHLAKFIDLGKKNIVVYADERFTDAFKKLGCDVWHPSLQKNFYDICIYDDELYKIPLGKQINMKSFMRENYYYFIRDPDVSKYSIGNFVYLKIIIDVCIGGFPPEGFSLERGIALYPTSREYTRKRFCGELMQMHHFLPHKCEVVTETEEDYFYFTILLKCETNPNYLN